MSTLLYFILISLIKISYTVSWNAQFNPNSSIVHMNQESTITLQLSDLSNNDIKDIYLKSENVNFATVNFKIPIDDIKSGNWKGDFNVSGVFLGKTNVFVEIVKNSNETEKSDSSLNVIVIREERAIDHIFTGSVAILVSILYINFGAALDVSKLKEILRKPVGPIIAFFCQFLAMPLLSYGLGHLIFADSPELQLGLFFTGISPAGGASNIWAAILNGNMNLSITMTTLSTFAAFGMMPLWIFTLAVTLFNNANLGVPYVKISYFAIGLIIPLAIGLLIQKYFPRVTAVLVKIIKPVSAILIIFIVIFAIVTNLYLFEIFSWRIIVAGLGLPWLGYMIGWLAAKLFKQNAADALTIAIETGIQNTGIAIFLLRFSLPQPEADKTTVLPVAVAIMTPFPLILLYIVQKIRGRLANNTNEAKELCEDSDLNRST